MGLMEPRYVTWNVVNFITVNSMVVVMACIGLVVFHWYKQRGSTQKGS